MEKERLLTTIQTQRLERDARICDEFLRLKNMYSPVATSWGICKLVEKSTGVKRGVVAYVTKRAGIYR